MDNELIYCCELTDTSSNSEIGTEYLSIFNYDFSSYLDKENDTYRHILYFQDEKVAALAAADLAIIPIEWLDTGLNLSDIKLFPIEKKDWSEVWKKHFKIQHINEKVTIKPSWLDYKQKSDDEVIIKIDPGMSFGTGRHATTRFCLKMLSEIKGKDKYTLLDAGCGSGILTIGAYKMGFNSITAFDYDPECIKCTKENLIENDIDISDINLTIADITELNTTQKEIEQYDVVVVNILAHILYESRTTILSLMKPASYLILAGILTTEYNKIRDAFIELGVKEIKTLTEDEWTGGMFSYKN